MSARPSPMAHVLELHPRKLRPLARTQADRDSHKATVRAHALAAGHPSVYDYEAEREVTVLLAFSLGEASRIRTLLRGTKLDDDAKIEAAIRRQMSGGVVDTDPTPARGTVRP